MKISHFTRNLLAVFAVFIGLYPLLYFTATIRNHGLLQTKPQELLHNPLWNAAFYVHISGGGFALLSGWLQFNKERRNRHLRFHRVLGRCYVTAVAASGIAGLYVALYATGGLISAMGFASLALCWLFTGIMAFKTAVQRQIEAHRQWMILNYSLTFAAVTLRIWLLLLIASGLFDFVPGYRIISWLAWVPNLLFSYWLIQKQERKKLVFE